MSDQEQQTTSDDDGAKKALERERQARRDAVRVQKELQAQLDEAKAQLARSAGTSESDLDVATLRAENEALKAQFERANNELADTRQSMAFSSAYRKLGGRIDDDFDSDLYKLVKDKIKGGENLEEFVAGIKSQAKYNIYFGAKNRGTTDISSKTTVEAMDKARLKRQIMSNNSLTPLEKMDLAARHGIA
jgi:dynactin complex subunit